MMVTVVAGRAALVPENTWETYFTLNVVYLQRSIRAPGSPAWVPGPLFWVPWGHFRGSPAWVPGAGF